MWMDECDEDHMPLLITLVRGKIIHPNKLKRHYKHVSLNDPYSNSAKPRMTIKNKEQVVKGMLTNKNFIPYWYGYIAKYRNLIIEILSNVNYK